ncbi:MAG: autotransporter outer rane beta-barrel protein, partial [Variovorax sp.]|nr:autotransporter outer rane beta-barrel protein [Variovorax sp.]
MNTSYRSVWNHALGAWVAVSEVTRSRGKRSGSAVAIAAATLLGGLTGTAALAQSHDYADGAYAVDITTTVTPTVELNTDLNIDAQQVNIVTGPGGIIKTGAGTLTLSNAANDYVGTTTVNAGILRVASDANLGNAASGLQLNGGTFQFGANNVTSARAITVLAGGGTIDVNDTTGNVLSGGFVGAGPLTLVNNGTDATALPRLTLSGSSTAFTGTTRVGNDVTADFASGRLNVAITSNGALGTGSNIVNIYNN